MIFLHTLVFCFFFILRATYLISENCVTLLVFLNLTVIYVMLSPIPCHPWNLRTEVHGDCFLGFNYFFGKYFPCTLYIQTETATKWVMKNQWSRMLLVITLILELISGGAKRLTHSFPHSASYRLLMLNFNLVIDPMQK